MGINSLSKNRYLPAFPKASAASTKLPGETSRPPKPPSDEGGWRSRSAVAARAGLYTGPARTASWISASQDKPLRLKPNSHLLEAARKHGGNRGGRRCAGRRFHR